MTRLLIVLLIALLLCLTVPAQSASVQEREPSRQPVLRIETGMHTAPIYRIAVDRAGKFLVTASDDKTARVWELASGRLLRVLRVPVGAGDQGKLYAAAISPDGNTIAANWIRNQTTRNDIAMVFFSGHGVNDQSNSFFFCPYNIDVKSMSRTGVPYSDIRNAVSAVKGKVLFFVDSCHSGDPLGLAARRDINFFVNDLSSARNGVVVISATLSSELAYEKAEWNNGAFTKALVEGMNGAAIFREGGVTYALLFDYVAERVEKLTDRRQHPSLGAQAVPRFLIAWKK